MVRTRHVSVAFATKERQNAAKHGHMQLGPSSVVVMSGSDDDSDKEEEETLMMWPLPEGVTAAQITGGLSMAGRTAVRNTIAFAVDVKHAEAMNAGFNAAGGGASHAVQELVTVYLLQACSCQRTLTR